MEYVKSLNDQIDELLLEKRRIFLSKAVDPTSAEEIIKRLWYLEIKDPKAPILFIINSPGGVTDSGMAIFDVAAMIKCPIHTGIVPHAPCGVNGPSAVREGLDTDPRKV